MALATGACCLNPLGPKLLTAVAGFAGNNNLAGISEWRALTIDSLSGVLFGGSLLITALLLRISPRRIWIGEVLLILVFGVATLTAIRMLVWWALVWPWVVAPHAAAAWLLYRPVAANNEEDLADARRAAAGRLLLAAACLLATFWWAPPTYALVTGRSRESGAILSRNTPEELAEQLVRQKIRGRFYAPMDWADYLVWQTDGAVEPLVYSHVHLTGEALWSDYRRIESGSTDWLALADRHGLEYLILSPDRCGRLADRALRSPRCQLLYKDRQSMLVRIAPANTP